MWVLINRQVGGLHGDQAIYRKGVARRIVKNLLNKEINFPIMVMGEDLP